MMGDGKAWVQQWAWATKSKSPTTSKASGFERNNIIFSGLYIKCPVLVNTLQRHR